jgi:hypothetical protein
MLLFPIIFGSLGLHRALILPGSALSCPERVCSTAIVVVVCLGRLFIKVLAFPSLFQKILELQISLSAYFFETCLSFRLSLSLLNL